MKKNKNEWKKLKEANFDYEININGQVRNIKSKKLIKPKGYSYRITSNSEPIHLGSINELRWEYFKGEITSNLYLRGWKKCNAMYKDAKPYYFISFQGDVYNAKLDSFICPIKKQDGYLSVHIKPREVLYHRLLGLFIDIPTKYNNFTKQELTIDHINSIRDDNRLENLRWMPLSENVSISHNNKDRKYNQNRIYNTK